MSEHCGTITEEGNTVCIPGSCSCSPEAKPKESASINLLPPDSNGALIVAKLKKIFPTTKAEDADVAENS